jgi:hypothetical protein
VCIMAEHEQSESPTKRPYRTKRKRPCDLCRSRKVYCHIEDVAPCLQCQKSEVECTFVGRTAKRRHVVQTAEAIQSPDDERADGITPVGQARDFLPRSPNSGSSGQNRRLQSSNSQPVQQIQPIIQGIHNPQHSIADQMDPGTMFDFNMMEFESLSYIGLDTVPQDGSLEEYSLLAQRAGTIPTPRAPGTIQQIAVHEAGEPSHINSIDGKDGVHGEYFGLSGETDPFLLRNYKYDDHGEFRMFKLVFRQTANDIHNIIPQGSAHPSPASYSSTAGLDLGPSLRTQGRSTTAQVPVQFMMAADELADDAKEDTVVRKDVSPANVRDELDKLVLPEDGSRLIAL